MKFPEGTNISEIIDIPHNGVPTEALAGNLIYRQSLTTDLKACPKMAAYRWIYEFGTEDTDLNEAYIPFMAAILGTAGHAVIETMHRQKKFDYGIIDLYQMMQEEFNEALLEYPIEPKVSAGFDSIQEEIESKAIVYGEFLEGYQKQHLALKTPLLITMFEQPFVLITKYKGEYFIFSGTMDQVGVYQDGVFTLRDLKFRDNAFKPNYIELQLSHQMIVYATALKYGVPACKECRPRYNEDMAEMTRTVIYDGPCEKCKSKIGTWAWPNKFPAQCELVWLKDFQILKRKYRGKPAGAFKGKGVYTTFLKQSRIQHYMTDVLEWCHAFRHGFHPRHAGEMCMLFCNYQKQCLRELRMDDILDDENTSISSEREDTVNFV